MPTGIYQYKLNQGFQKGHKSYLTEISKDRIRRAHLGENNHFYGKHHSEETKKKMSEIHKRIGNRPPSRKGIKMSEESRRKMSEAHKGKKRKAHSEETKRKISESLKGEKSYLWRGGITPEIIKIRKSIDNSLWREAVFARDNWTCQKCEIRGGILHPHHIQNFAQFPELRFAIDNGITFCKNCHKLFHKIYGKKNNTKEQINLFNEKSIL